MGEPLMNSLDGGGGGVSRPHDSAKACPTWGLKSLLVFSGIALKRGLRRSNRVVLMSKGERWRQISPGGGGFGATRHEPSLSDRAVLAMESMGKRSNGFVSIVLRP